LGPKNALGNPNRSTISLPINTCTDSPEGKAAYDELLNIQLKEINRLEDEYSKERDKLEAENPDSSQPENPERTSVSNPEGNREAGPDSQGQNPSEVEELSQAEMEQAMDHFGGELFSEPEVEQSEIEKLRNLLKMQCRWTRLISSG